MITFDYFISKMQMPASLWVRVGAPPLPQFASSYFSPTRNNLIERAYRLDSRCKFIEGKHMKPAFIPKCQSVWQKSCEVYTNAVSFRLPWRYAFFNFVNSMSQPDFWEDTLSNPSDWTLNQQSYEGKNHLPPSICQGNNALIQFGMKHITPESMKQYQEKRKGRRTAKR